MNDVCTGDAAFYFLPKVIGDRKRKIEASYHEAKIIWDKNKLYVFEHQNMLKNY